ncbi:MAG TPA: hypothetical protein VGB76_09170 [Pyrinomonadaceae bacterium]|jgi:hypothetical protein
MFKFRQFAAALFLVAATLASSVAVQAAFREYLPLVGAELGRPFAVKYLGAIESRPSPHRQLDLGVATATLAYTEETELMLSGRDKAGHAWSVGLGDACGSGEAYTADLDRNGQRDFLLVLPTCGNGLAPTHHLIAVTFESDGRPARFEVEGYFDADRKGIFDLRDIDRDGRAELIYMNFSDGYWITNLYTATGARWRRIEGRFGGRAYPLHTRFTNRPNRRAVRPAPGRRPFAPDLSNDAPRLRGQLRSYRWANVSQSEDIELNFETGEGRQVKCQPVSWYGSFTVVVDSARERKIFTLSSREEWFRPSLESLVEHRYEAALYGQRDAEHCSPETLWVTIK